MSIFVEISIIIVLATVVSIIMKLLKQPLIIGYIATGLLAGPYVLRIIQTQETIQALAEIGIAFLLFIVGINLSPRVIREVGAISLITGLGQVIFTSGIGFLIARTLGFDTTTALYVAVALTFSSTIIILKLLSDKGDLNKLYGKISVGFLLVQDIVATFILILIASFSETGVEDRIVSGMMLLGKGIVLTVFFLFIGAKVLPILERFFARSQELLFISSIGWGLGVASLFHAVGLSIEVGALIAGVTLAVSPYHYEIAAKMRPLRDFFVVLFFVVLGSQIALGDVTAQIVPAVILSLFVLVGNPLIVIILMGMLGYRKRTGFLAGLTVAQISEFSLILIALGFRNGHVSSDIVSLVTMVGIITIAASTYMILYANRIYGLLAPLLSIFERKKARQEQNYDEEYDIILFGANRIGQDFVNVFSHSEKKLLVVDYDPKTIELLDKAGIACRYGDVEDLEFLDELPFSSVKMIISTIPDAEANALLLKKIQERKEDIIVIATAYSILDAEMLYEEGASYVVTPHFIGGALVSEMIDKYGFHADSFAFERTKHITYLNLKKRQEGMHVRSDIY